MRGRLFGALGLVWALALAGCGLSGCGVAPESPVSIDGLRSDPDHRGLLGGACDGAARLVVTETATRIDAEVVLGRSRHGSGACPAVGITRMVGARLAQPIGERTIWSGGRQQVPFDGARLVVPSTLPPAFTEVKETGFIDERPSDPDGAQVTSTWVVERFDAASASRSGGSCRPGRGSVGVLVGRSTLHSSRDLALVDTVRIGAVKARLYRQGSSTKPSGWTYAWTADGGSVEVATSPYCGFDRVLDQTELLDVAKSLQPA